MIKIFNNIRMSDIIKEKSFPKNYPAEALKIIQTLSFTGDENLKLVGSQALRSQEYAGDYDIYNTVELKEKSDDKAIAKLVKKFQSIISSIKKMPDAFLGDIKAGLVPEWEVLPATYKTFSAKKARTKLVQLNKDGVITKYEMEDAMKYIKPNASLADFLIAKNNIKFHIVRWTATTVAQGSQKLRDGRTYTLAEAFKAPSIVKVDVIGSVTNRYVEFSCIYEFKNNGKPVNDVKLDIKRSLDDAILSYTAEGKYFKVLKRQFSLAKYKNDMASIKKLNALLNSDLGKLYVIQSDMATLVALLDYPDAPVKMIKKELGQFVERFAKIYTLPSFLKMESKLIDDINTAVKFASKPRLVARLKIINQEIENVLNKSTTSVLKGRGMCNYRPVIR
jgi:hypothetical protein